MPKKSIEDYLKTIYDLQEEGAKVSTSKIAKRLNFAPASVTGMIKKLSDMKLVTYQKYQGVLLTTAGTRIALEVIRHHRLIELFLAQALDVPWDKVHDEAEKWEHVLSEDMEDRIDKLLGYPTHDPHGSPIPPRGGDMPKTSTITLDQLKVGDKASISEVSDHDPEMLRYLGDLGLYPKTKLSIVAIEPFDGPITLHVNGKDINLGPTVARFIRVDMT